MSELNIKMAVVVSINSFTNMAILAENPVPLVILNFTKLKY